MDIENLLKKYGFKEPHVIEVERGVFAPTPYPNTKKFHRLIFQTFNYPIEEPYYWVVKSLKTDFSFNRFIKVVDTFAASEHSSMFGVASQRLGIQQDKVSNYLATIGKMVKDLLKIIRDLRLLDERLSYYEQSFKGDKSAEVTLKGIWIDLVEGGAKNPASVFGMAKEVGFSLLPDLFFSIDVKNASEVDKKIDELRKRESFSEQLLRVVARKLKSYYTWKEHTYKELKTRKLFTLKYLKQHYEVLHLYISWLKPYFENIKRLTLHPKFRENVELISAFEGSMIEIEYLAIKDDGKSLYKPVIIVNFLYRTRPHMLYTQEYQRGPIHLGKVEFTLRGYAWTEKEIKNYIDMKRESELLFFSDYDSAIKETINALGDDLKKYLEEAEKEIKGEKEEKKKENKQNKIKYADPFTSLFLGFKELITAFIPQKIDLSFSKKQIEEYKKSKDRKKAEKSIDVPLCKTYENFKKAHRMLAW